MLEVVCRVRVCGIVRVEKGPDAYITQDERSEKRATRLPLIRVKPPPPSGEECLMNPRKPYCIQKPEKKPAPSVPHSTTIPMVVVKIVVFILLFIYPIDLTRRENVAAAASLWNESIVRCNRESSRTDK